MNIATSFADYLASLGLGTVGTDIKVGSVPQDAPDSCFWIVTAGGAPEQINETGEMVKNYILNVFFRSSVAHDVYDNLQFLEDSINTDDCTQLDGFDTISMTATSFPADQDIDSEERTVGLVQVTIKVYSE